MEGDGIMFKVVKRDGETDDFNLAKIRGAIEKAFKATGKEYTDDIIELLGLRVTADFQSKIKDGVVHVEDIQDSVETVLEQVGYTDVAKIHEESITISARGTIGYVCLRLEPYVPIVRLISIIPNKKELSAKYLYLWALTQNITGTGTTQQQLTVPIFRKTPISIPSDTKLKQFNSIADPLFSQIESNKKENIKLSTLRDTLLPKLMSGEISVEEVSLD